MLCYYVTDQVNQSAYTLDAAKSMIVTSSLIGIGRETVLPGRMEQLLRRPLAEGGEGTVEEDQGQAGPHRRHEPWQVLRLEGSHVRGRRNGLQSLGLGHGIQGDGPAARPPGGGLPFAVVRLPQGHGTEQTGRVGGDGQPVRHVRRLRERLPGVRPDQRREGHRPGQAAHGQGHGPRARRSPGSTPTGPSCA